VALESGGRKTGTEMSSQSWKKGKENNSHSVSRKEFRYANIFFIIIIHLFTCAYIVGVISPPTTRPHPLPLNPPHIQAEPVLPLSLILLKRRHKHNKKDKAFLLVELRIAIQRDS
jgi:hypothetical protein